MLARVRAWLLLALFLSAGTSLPSADALLHHQHPEPFRVHYDPAGGCAEHADHCTLGRTPPGSSAVAPVVFVVRPPGTTGRTRSQSRPRVRSMRGPPSSLPPELLRRR